ncbi:TolC family protein [Variovorax saccharolyticus]|uniref:TolC family protein n=1 Tax=Variovorax saccharolyticus TaxID=3053516 RepID=UPI002574E803|nr:TolC family protein [Variovorax sp. J22R187]MDM0018213.1 TolC family protein [Variovorax sp. J22R187]
MNSTHWGTPGALVLALACGLPVQAQPAASGGGSIKQGFEAAWARQPEYRGAGLRRDAATASEAAAQRWTPEPPALELTAKGDRLTSNTGAREYEAKVAVPIWLPGEKSRSLAAAHADSGAVEARLFAAQWRLAAEVREAYWTYAKASLDRSLAQQRLSGSQQLAADVARRVGAGDLARSDSHQAEAAVAAAEGAVAESDAALAQAAQRWTALTGAAPLAVEQLASEARPVEPPADASHPVLQDLVARADVARRQAELAAAQTRANPELMLGVTRERSDANERYAQVLSVAVRIPLGRLSRSDARIAVAGAEQTEAEAQLLVEQARIGAEARAASERVKALALAVEAAERRSRLAGESRGFFEKSFRLGETDLPTRLRIEQEAADAQRQAARSRIDLAAAVSQWRQALGLLPQ